MRNWTWLAVLAFCFALAAPVRAQDEGANDKEALKTEMKELMKAERDKKNQLNKHKKAHSKDEALAELQKAVTDARKALSDAQKALDEKMMETLKNDPEAATVVKEMEELQAKIKEVKEKMRGNPKEKKPKKQKKDEGDAPMEE